MQVVIGIDPHKASHTAVAIDEAEDEVARRQILQDLQAGELTAGRRGS